MIIIREMVTNRSSSVIFNNLGSEVVSSEGIGRAINRKGQESSLDIHTEVSTIDGTGSTKLFPEWALQCIQTFGEDQESGVVRVKEFRRTTGHMSGKGTFDRGHVHNITLLAGCLASLTPDLT